MIDLKFRDDLLAEQGFTDRQCNLVHLLCTTQMTIREAAEAVGVNHDTARRWLAHDIYPSLDVDSIAEMRVVMFLPRSEAAWIEDYRARSQMQRQPTLQTFNVRSGRIGRASVDDVTRAHRRGK